MGGRLQYGSESPADLDFSIVGNTGIRFHNRKRKVAIDWRQKVGFSAGPKKIIPELSSFAPKNFVPLRLLPSVIGSTTK